MECPSGGWEHGEIAHFNFLPPFLGRKQSLKEVVENIMLIKAKVKEKLRLLGTPGSWNHITEQLGSHGYLGLDCKCLGRNNAPLSDLGLVFEEPSGPPEMLTLISQSPLWARGDLEAATPGSETL